jgi:hypothetical protein
VQKLRGGGCPVISQRRELEPAAGQRAGRQDVVDGEILRQLHMAHLVGPASPSRPRVTPLRGEGYRMWSSRSRPFVSTVQVDRYGDLVLPVHEEFRSALGKGGGELSSARSFASTTARAASYMAVLGPDVVAQRKLLPGGPGVARQRGLLARLGATRGALIGPDRPGRSSWTWYGASSLPSPQGQR